MASILPTILSAAACEYPSLSLAATAPVNVAYFFLPILIGISLIANAPNLNNMPVTTSNIAARDQLPSQKDYKNILIATATASSSSYENQAFNVIDSDEKTKWTSKGMDEYLLLQLSDVAQVHRIDIEWDPELSRTGRFTVLTAEQDDASDAQTWVSGNQETSLFTSIEDTEGVKAKIIKIVCGGNAENDLNGITNIAVYGYDSKESKPQSAAAAAAVAPKTDKAKGK